MDETLGIEINRRALLPIVAELFAMLGGLTILPRCEHRAVLAILRPAESAVRRLIAMLAHRLVVVMVGQRAGPSGTISRGTGGGVPAFALLDPRLTVGPKTTHVPGHGPNVRGFDGLSPSPPEPTTPMPGDPLDAARLHERIAALRGALDDLPRNATRLARALAKKVLPIRAIRPGRPPGHREKRRHPVDQILADCHGLALMVLNEAPTRVPP